MDRTSSEYVVASAQHLLHLTALSRAQSAARCFRSLSRIGMHAVQAALQVSFIVRTAW
jgi:hypothetical protein